MEQTNRGDYLVYGMAFWYSSIRETNDGGKTPSSARQVTTHHSPSEKEGFPETRQHPTKHSLKNTRGNSPLPLWQTSSVLTATCLSPQRSGDQSDTQRGLNRHPLRPTPMRFLEEQQLGRNPP